MLAFFFSRSCIIALECLRSLEQLGPVEGRGMTTGQGEVVSSGSAAGPVKKVLAQKKLGYTCVLGSENWWVIAARYDLSRQPTPSSKRLIYLASSVPYSLFQPNVHHRQLDALSPLLMRMRNSSRLGFSCIQFGKRKSSVSASCRLCRRCVCCLPTTVSHPPYPRCEHFLQYADPRPHHLGTGSAWRPNAC